MLIGAHDAIRRETKLYAVLIWLATKINALLKLVQISNAVLNPFMARLFS